MDGGIFIGRHRGSGLALAPAAAAAAFARNGTRAALAASLTALQYNDEEGNRATLAAAREHPDALLPMAVINPVRYRPSRGRVEALRAQGFHVAALFPHWPGHGDGLDSLAVARVAQECADAGLPLQVAVTTRRDLSDLAARVAPAGGPVLVRWAGRPGYAVTSELLCLAEQFPELLFDAGAAVQVGGLELLAETIGADRLFVASGMPLHYGACPYFLVHASELSEADKQSVLHGTLDRLLGRATGPVAPPAEFDRLMRHPKADLLYNTGSFNVIETRIDVDSLARVMTGTNTAVAVSASMLGVFESIAEGNAETAAFLEHDARARGLVVVSPMDVPASLEQMARYRDHGGFVGIKTIQDDAYGVALDDARFEPILAALREIPDWSIMAHPTGIGAAAARHPELRFVSEHGTWRHRENAGLGNMFFDFNTSATALADTDVADLFDAVGPERIVFSSDAPLIAPAFTLAKLADLALDDARLDAVLRSNAAQAFPRMAAAVHAA